MNLPEKRLTHCLCDGRISAAIAVALQKLGISVTPTVPLPELPEPISCHPDMQLFDFEDKSLLLSPNANESLSDHLSALGFRVVLGSKTLAGEYPFDIAYNACLLGTTLFCNEKYTAPELKERAGKVVSVRQGYAKCSMLPVAEHAFITQDRGIFEAAKALSFDVLLVTPFNIRLPGYPHGFIGGCGGKISPDTLAFFGSGEALPCFTEIRNFIESHKVKPLFLSDEPLTDYGSLIGLTT